MVLVDFRAFFDHSLQQLSEFIRFGAMDGQFPYEFIGLGAMHSNLPYEFIGFGSMDDHLSHECIGFGSMDTNVPREFIGFGSMDCNLSYEFIGFGAMDGQVHCSPCFLNYSARVHALQEQGMASALESVYQARQPCFAYRSPSQKGYPWLQTL